MKERGILFSAPMVRALLAGTKTQTRRIVKPQWKCCTECFESGVPHNGEEAIFGGGPYLRIPFCEHNDISGGRMRCPHGTVGDRLWVRETWAEIDDSYGAPCMVFRADSAACHIGGDEKGKEWLCGDWHKFDVDDGQKWKPGIHMFRWASRITLEITEIRVERVQSISEADAKAEGVEPWEEHKNIPYLRNHKRLGPHFFEFGSLWEKINGTDSWKANPWVWALTFRKLEGAA